MHFASFAPARTGTTDLPIPDFVEIDLAWG